MFCSLLSEYLTLTSLLEQLLFKVSNVIVLVAVVLTYSCVTYSSSVFSTLILFPITYGCVVPKSTVPMLLDIVRPLFVAVSPSNFSLVESHAGPSSNYCQDISEPLHFNQSSGASYVTGPLIYRDVSALGVLVKSENCNALHLVSLSLWS